MFFIIEFFLTIGKKIIILIFKEFENLSVEKKTLSTALGFEPRSFDCRKFETQLINL